MNAKIVALASFGLLKSLPDVAQASFCGFIMSCEALQKMCAYWMNNTAKANMIAFMTLALVNKAKTTAQAAIEGIEKNKLKINLLKVFFQQKII